MSDIFCCNSINPYKARRLDHESKFDTLMTWTRSQDIVVNPADHAVFPELGPAFVVQLVRQVNFGPLESKRYFAPTEGANGAFVEVIEDDLVEANFKKLNAFKNFRCSTHNKFFEVDLYQKNPLNTHHRCSDIDRPGSKIDL